MVLRRTDERQREQLRIRGHLGLVGPPVVGPTMLPGNTRHTVASGLTQKRLAQNFMHGKRLHARRHGDAGGGACPRYFSSLAPPFGVAFGRGRDSRASAAFLFSFMMAASLFISSATCDLSAALK